MNLPIRAYRADGCDVLPEQGNELEWKVIAHAGSSSYYDKFPGRLRCHKSGISDRIVNFLNAKQYTDISSLSRMLPIWIKYTLENND